MIKRLAFYRGDYHDSLGLEDFIADADDILSGRTDYEYRPLAGLDSTPDGFIIECLSNFALGVIEGQEPNGHLLDLTQRCRFYSFVLEKMFLDGNPEYLAPDFEKYGEWLLQFIATGRADLQDRLEEIALSVVKSGRYETPPGTGGYFTSASKLGVFALEMLAALRGETIDWPSFHIPADPFWLEAARIGLTERDPVRAADWARQLCEAHMQTLQTDKDNFSTGASDGYEIEFEAHFLWPITVQAFLRLRGKLGLETAEIDHPLMRTSFAILQVWLVPAGSWQAEPWFTDIVDRTQAAAPALGPDLKLIR